MQLRLLYYLAKAALIILPACALASEGSIETSQKDIQRFLNFRIRPIGLLFGSDGIDVDLGLGESWSLGPSFDRLKTDSGLNQVSLYQLGLVYTWFVGSPRFSNSWILRGIIYYIPISISEQKTLGVRTQNYGNFAMGALIGRQLMTPIGFNLGFAMGLAYHYQLSSSPTSAGPPIINPVTNAQSVEPVMDLTLGWAF